MDSLFLFVFEVMFERVDDMKEIVEHPMSPAGRESSIFALCSSFSEADSHMTIRRLLRTWLDPWYKLIIWLGNSERQQL